MLGLWSRMAVLCFCEVSPGGASALRACHLVRPRLVHPQGVRARHPANDFCEVSPGGASALRA